MIRLQPETTISHGGRYKEIGCVAISVPALDFIAAITAQPPTAESLGFDPETIDGTRIWHEYATGAVEAGELSQGFGPDWEKTDMKIQAWLKAAVAKELQVQNI